VPTPDELRTTIDRYVTTINGRDPDAIADLFTEDAVQADPASRPPGLPTSAGRPSPSSSPPGSP
jgi:ketosteroid isomerase-like protein